MAKSKKLSGNILLNNKPMVQVTDLEINPVGDTVYAITVRMQLEEPIIPMHDPREMTKKYQEMVYQHPLLGSRYYQVALIDSGIMDLDGKCTLVLFFKGTAKPSPIEMPKLGGIMLVNK